MFVFLHQRYVQQEWRSDFCCIWCSNSKSKRRSTNINTLLHHLNFSHDQAIISCMFDEENDTHQIQINLNLSFEQETNPFFFHSRSKSSPPATYISTIHIANLGRKRSSTNSSSSLLPFCHTCFNYHTPITSTNTYDMVKTELHSAIFETENRLTKFHRLNRYEKNHKINTKKRRLKSSLRSSSNSNRRSSSSSSSSRRKKVKVHWAQKLAHFAKQSQESPLSPSGISDHDRLGNDIFGISSEDSSSDDDNTKADRSSGLLSDTSMGDGNSDTMVNQLVAPFQLVQCIPSNHKNKSNVNNSNGLHSLGLGRNATNNAQIKMQISRKAKPSSTSASSTSSSTKQTVPSTTTVVNDTRGFSMGTTGIDTPTSTHSKKTTGTSSDTGSVASKPSSSSSSSSSSDTRDKRNGNGFGGMYCQMQSCHPLKTHYVRNNRRSTEKNLRCFPCCNIGGHVSQGFCGRGLKQKVILTDVCLDIIGRNINPLTKVTCVVELTVYNEFPVNRPVLGSVYKPQDIWSRLKKSKTNTTEPWKRPYWKGVIDRSNLLKLPSNEIDFTFKPSHWHYGWRSNKHTNKSKHTCRMYVFMEMNDQSLLWMMAE